MNFIAEFTNKNTENDSEFIELGIMKLALEISKVFIQLDENIFDGIDRVIIINKTKTKNEIIEKFLNKFTIRFEAFYKNNQQTAKQLISLFPDPDIINRDIKRSIRIDNLINNLSVGSTKIITKENNIGYVNYAQSIIDNNEVRFDKIIYKGNQSRINSSMHYEVIDADRYYAIKKTLSKIPKEPEDQIEAHFYKHDPFFDHLDKAFVREIEKLIKEKDSRALIYGEDNFIAIKSKDYVFNDEESDYYDARMGIPFINKNNSNNIAINYIHQLNNEKFNELRKQIMPLIQANKRLLFLGNYLDIDDLIGIYCKNIPIPNSGNVKAVITKLFIALLLEARVLEGRFSFIYEAIIKNSFKIFLEEIETLNELYEAIKHIDEITTEDLLSNVFFWIKFSEVLESQRNKNKVKVHEPENTLSMIFENGEWIMIYNDDELIKSKREFMIYLDVIIQHQIKFNESIDVVTLRKAVIKYKREILNVNPKGNTKKLEEETCRITTDKAFRDFKGQLREEKMFLEDKLKKGYVIHKGRKKFFDEFINYKKCQYSFNIRNINLQENKSPIDDNFFDDLD